jgi:hypothetical protein
MKFRTRNEDERSLFACLFSRGSEIPSYDSPSRYSSKRMVRVHYELFDNLSLTIDVVSR